MAIDRSEGEGNKNDGEAKGDQVGATNKNPHLDGERRGGKAS